jgi:D-sedoheptulose 7-phosphate isomerase
MAERLDLVRRTLRESAEVQLRTAERCAESIDLAGALMTASIKDGGKVLLCGNGGSAAGCQHMAAEMVHVLTKANLRGALPALALTTDTSLLSAIGNDLGFEHVFARQVEALGRKGDVLVCISTSGNSKNVVRAAGRARELGLKVIALTGGHGGELAALADLEVRVPSDSVQHIQESHTAVGHALCMLVELDHARGAR